MDSHVRTIAKAFSWRFVATMVTFSVAYMVTGKLTIAVEIGAIDTLIKLGAYYYHERLWFRIKLGQLPKPEYEI